MCVLRNRKLMKRPYTWAVHINLNEEYRPDQVSPMWKKVARKLEDRCIVALWVREPNRLNKLHYHIIVKNQISKADLKKAIEDAMPPWSVVKWRKRVEQIKNEWRLCHSVFKAKAKGRTKKGVLVNDLYRHKRLLFLPKMPFKKVAPSVTFGKAARARRNCGTRSRLSRSRSGRDWRSQTLRPDRAGSEGDRAEQVDPKVEADAASLKFA
jgi:hypothetical protein